MKKLFISLTPLFLLGSSAFAITASTDPSNPTLISSYQTPFSTTAATAWNGTGSGGDNQIDCYIKVDAETSFFGFIVSGGGGWHANLNLLLDSTHALTMTTQHALNMNYYTPGGTPGQATGYSMDFNFQLQSGQTAGVVNFTNLSAFGNSNDPSPCKGLYINLTTTDNNNTGNPGFTTFGICGKRVIFGAGITANISGELYVKGKLTTSHSEIEYDSEFIVQGIVHTGLDSESLGISTFEDTNFTVESMGIFNSKGGLALNNTKTIVAGTINITDATKGLIIRNMSDSNITGYGKINTDALTLDGATYDTNGDVHNSIITKKTSGADFSLFVEGGNSTIMTSLGSGLMANANNVSIKSGSLTLESGVHMSVDNTSSSTAKFLNNGGTVTINTGALLEIKSKPAAWQVSTIAGNMIVDGGTVKETTPNSAYALTVYAGKTLTIKNGGRVEITNATDSYLNLNGGNVTVEDASSVIRSKGIAWFDSNSQKGGTLTLASASNLELKTNLLFMRTPTAKVVLGGNGNYEFGDIIIHGTVEANVLTFDLNGSKAHFTNLRDLGSAGARGTVVFEDFVANAVKIDGLTNASIVSDAGTGVGTIATAHGIAKIIAKDSAGVAILGIWSIDTNGYLTISGLIPEPAEWAAIFGALALGFAIYRRRLLKR